uniref:Myb/SANT-like DNA-binding domain-containing protein n=1 Tax=Manihot esculenta TaxID=3983 RepID=A0A2C9UMQ7_MANES
MLIDAWGERYLELRRGNLKQKHWKEVADIVSSREEYKKAAKTNIQCKNRIDTVKKKYKLEKAKIAAGGGPSKWPFFERLDKLIGPTTKILVTAAVAAAPLTSKVAMGIPVGIHNGGANSEDSLPPEKKLRGVVQRGVNTKEVKERKGWRNLIRMLAQVILKFEEVYEQAKNMKLQQVVLMEKIRMKFARELELQMMQFFIKTQIETSQLKCTRREEMIVIKIITSVVTHFTDVLKEFNFFSLSATYHVLGMIKSLGKILS